MPAEQPLANLLGRRHGRTTPPHRRTNCIAQAIDQLPELGRFLPPTLLGFIGTELHKAVFVPLLDASAGAEVKAYAMEKAALRLAVLEAHLQQHEHLEGSFGIADIYLIVVLNWAPYAGVDLAAWPAVKAYHRRIGQCEAVARALREELALFQEEQRARA